MKFFKFFQAAQDEQQVERLSQLLSDYMEEKKLFEKVTYENNGDINIIPNRNDRLKEIDRVIITLMGDISKNRKMHDMAKKIKIR